MESLLDTRADLADGWRLMEERVRETGLDEDLITWSYFRVRRLLGVEEECPVPAPEDAVANFIELYFMDVHAVTDEDAQAASRALGEPLFVALVVSLGITEARARMELMLA